MDEDVVPGLPLDESVSLGGVEPLYGALFFQKSFSLRVSCLEASTCHRREAGGLSFRRQRLMNQRDNKRKTSITRERPVKKNYPPAAVVHGPWRPPGPQGRYRGRRHGPCAGHPRTGRAAPPGRGSLADAFRNANQPLTGRRWLVWRRKRGKLWLRRQSLLAFAAPLPAFRAAGSSVRPRAGNRERFVNQRGQGRRERRAGEKR